LQTEKYDFGTNDFEKCSATAKPIFEYLGAKNDWTYFDITILSYVIHCAKTFVQAIAFMEKALNLLDTKFSNEGDYWGVRFAIQFNLIPRIVHARYAIDMQGQHEVSQDEVDKAFSLYMPVVLKVCEDYNFQAYKLMTLVRKGIYDGDYAAVETNLQLMRKLPTSEERGLYKTTVDEILRYHYLMDVSFSDRQLNLVHGYHIRKAREALKMPLKTLAKLLHINDRYLGQIERGEGGLSGILLYRAAEFLGVDMNYLYYGNRNRPALGSKVNQDSHVSAMALLLQDLTFDEKELLLAQAKVFAEHRTNRN